MRLLIFLLFLLPLSLIGQVESQFNGTLNVFSGTRIGSTNTFTISGIFNSTTTSYTSSQSDTGDIVQVQSGARFYWLHIYSIASNSGGVVTCNVRDSSSTLTVFPTGKWSIFRPTPNLRLPLSPDGESNASKSAAFNTLALRVDGIQTAVSSATNCEQTITKTAHGFRKWTPIFWNGSTYIRPTADSIVPDYIVVDSLTANTFKVASCGTYTTTLSNGLYWYTNVSPGYSLTPDTTKVPLFQVLNTKLILDPIVGFNLMSGSGSTNLVQFTEPEGYAKINAPLNSYTANLTVSDTLQNGGTVDETTSLLYLKSVNKGTPTTDPDPQVVNGTTKVILALDTRDQDPRDPRDSIGMYTITYWTSDQNRQSGQKPYNYGYTIGTNAPRTPFYTSKAISNYWNYEQKYWQPGDSTGAASETYYNFENPMIRRGYRVSGLTAKHNMSSIHWAYSLTDFDIRDTTYRPKWQFKPKPRNEMSIVSMPDSTEFNFGKRTRYFAGPDGNILSATDTGLTVGNTFTARGTSIIPSDVTSSLNFGAATRKIPNGIGLYTRSSLGNQGELFFPRTYSATGVANETSGTNYIHWRSTGFGLSTTAGVTYFNVALNGSRNAFNLSAAGALALNTSPIYRLTLNGTIGTVGLGITGTHAPGDISTYLAPSGTISGDYFPIFSTSSTTQNMTWHFANTNTGNNANARLKIVSSGASTANSGKAYVHLQTTAGDMFIINNRQNNALEFRSGSVDENASTQKMRIDNTTGNVKIGTGSATAKLQLPSGTSSASTAPLKFTSGTNLTTAEAGAVEYDGIEFYGTTSTASRTILARVLKGSATLDFNSTAAGSVTDLTITVTGAADGDVVSLSVPNASQTTTGSFSAWVSAANTVTVRYRIAALVGSEDPASGTFKVTVTK